MRLAKSSVLVTGAGRGLGRAVAERLARRGARVVLVARTEEEIEAVARGLRAEGHQAWAIAADVGDKQAIYPLVGAAAQLAGPVDLLIHNASTLGPTPLPYLMDTPCEALEEVLAVNLVGPFRLTRAVAGNMLLRGGGRVVHLSSDAAVSAYPRWGAYSVSKAALDHLSRVFAAEFEGTGVSFWSVDPGEMDTRMHQDAVPEADRSTLRRPVDVADVLVRWVESDHLPSGARGEVHV